MSNRPDSSHPYPTPPFTPQQTTVTSHMSNGCLTKSNMHTSRSVLCNPHTIQFIIDRRTVIQHLYTNGGCHGQSGSSTGIFLRRRCATYTNIRVPRCLTEHDSTALKESCSVRYPGSKFYGLLQMKTPVQTYYGLLLYTRQ